MTARVELLIYWRVHITYSISMDVPGVSWSSSLHGVRWHGPAPPMARWIDVWPWTGAPSGQVEGWPGILQRCFIKDVFFDFFISKIYPTSIHFFVCFFDIFDFLYPKYIQHLSIFFVFFFLIFYIQNISNIYSFFCVFVFSWFFISKIYPTFWFVWWYIQNISMNITM